MNELRAMTYLARLNWSGSERHYLAACQRHAYIILRRAGHDRDTSRQAARHVNGRRNQTMAQVLDLAAR